MRILLFGILFLGLTIGSTAQGTVTEEQLAQNASNLKSIAASKGKNSVEYFDQLYLSAANLYSAKKYPESESLFKEALALSEKKYGRVSVETRNTHMDLCLARVQLPQYEAAVLDWREVVSIVGTLPGDNSDVLDWSERVGVMLGNAKQWQASIDALRYAQRWREKTGRQHLSNQYWNFWYTIDYSRKLGKEDSLHFLYERLVNTPAPPSEDMVYNIRNWASFSINRKEYFVFDKIELACQKYLSEKEKLNKKDVGYAEGLITLGRLYAANGQPERALKAFGDALVLNEQRKTTDPKNYLHTLNFIVGFSNDNRLYTPQIDKYFELFAQEYPKQKEDSENYLLNLMEIVRYNFNKGQPEKSISILDDALVYTEKLLGKNSDEYTLLKTYRTSMDPGAKISKKEQKQFVEAVGLGDMAIQQTQELGEYLSKGYYAKAVGVFEKHSGMIGDYYLSQKDYEGYVTMICGMALCYRDVGNLSKAFELLQKASAMAKEKLADNHEMTVFVLMNEGEFFQEMGNDAKAEAKFLDAIKILDQTQTKENKEKNDEMYYNILYKLGSVYRHWGYYRDAHQNFLDVAAYRSKKSGESSVDYANVMISIAEISESMNLLGRSEYYFKRAIPIIKKERGEESYNYISAGSRYASLLVQLSRFSEAEPYQIANKDFQNKALGNKSGSYLGAISDLAFQYVLAGNYAKAQPYFGELIQNNLYRVRNFFPSLSESEKGVFYRKVYADVNAYNVFANRYGKISKDEAGNMYDVQLSTKGLLFKSSNRVKETILQSKDDSLKASYNRWLEAKEMLGQIYQMSPEQKQSAGVNEKTWEEKVNVLERKLTRQSELFSNLLVTTPTWRSVQQKLLPGEAAVEMVKLVEPRYEYVYWKIDKGFGYDSLKTGEWSVYNVDSDRTPAHKAGLRSGDVIVSINGTALKGKNGAEVEELYSSKSIELSVKRGSVAPFKITIRDDSVFYITMIRRARYAVLVLTSETKAGPELITLENGDELETRYGRYYQNAIKQKQEDLYSYNQFWRPFQSKLSGIKKVYFCPDGVYNFINPNTLLNPSTKKYLLDEMEVAIVNNTSDILVAKPKGNLKKATLIGFPDYNKKSATGQAQANLSTDVDYRAITADTTATRFMSGSSVSELPGTKVEVNGIENILKSGRYEVNKLMMTDATEERVKTLHSPDILHIATHGFFMNELSAMGEGGRGITGVTAQKLSENPLLRSGLLLAGAGETIIKGKDESSREDGILTAYEAMNLDLQNTELVVLSACETGLGQVQNGEGVYGLNRAFRAAGAKSVLMSLWKVDDQATQQLMTEFYNEWLKGSSKLQAFRKAQLKLRETYSHPYYWGAFLAVGE